MLQTERMLLEQALPMTNAAVLVDTKKGSLQATFTLVDLEPEHPATHPPELPRALFNGLRDKGTLYQDAENQLFVDGRQIWLVNIGDYDGEG